MVAGQDVAGADGNPPASGVRTGAQDDKFFRGQEIPDENTL
jgi:hypothetical protein